MKCPQPVNAMSSGFCRIDFDASPQHDHERESVANAIASVALNGQSRRNFEHKFQSACNCFREHGLNGLDFRSIAKNPYIHWMERFIAVSLN